MVAFVDFLALSVFAALGLFCHWYKKFYRAQTTSSFKVYMLSHRQYTITTITTLVASMFTMASTGTVELSLTTIGTTFLYGYFIDSAMNKDL